MYEELCDAAAITARLERFLPADTATGGDSEPASVLQRAFAPFASFSTERHKYSATHKGRPLMVDLDFTKLVDPRASSASGSKDSDSACYSVGEVEIELTVCGVEQGQQRDAAGLHNTVVVAGTADEEKVVSAAVREASETIADFARGLPDVFRANTGGSAPTKLGAFLKQHQPELLARLMRGVRL